MIEGPEVIAVQHVEADRGEVGPEPRDAEQEEEGEDEGARFSHTGIVARLAAGIAISGLFVVLWVH